MNTRQRTFVVGEGITEQYYFKHLNGIKSYGITVRPRLFSISSIYQIANRTKELLQADANVICVFDADVSQRNDKEKGELNKFKKKYAKHQNVIICDTMPAIEFWFLLHYKKTHKEFTSNKALLSALKKHISGYEKKKGFLEKRPWVETLTKKQTQAIAHARAIQANGASYSKLYKAIEFLEQRKAQ